MRNRALWGCLVFIWVVQWIAMVYLPFADTSEPRYAEMARWMVVKGDWVTPWFTVDVPFWGKPPLSFWAQALGFTLFGLHEWAARFPAWLCLILASWLLTQILDKERLVGVLIYSSMTLVFISSGAVLTDPYLSVGVLLSWVSLIKHTRQSGGYWGYGFFLGLAVGALAKGPLALVFVFAPCVFLFLLQTARARLLAALQSLPWRLGGLLWCLCVLPWYVWAELKTPGFLHYFIVGEHIQRFLVPGWTGDLYGTAHQNPWGMIWPQAMVASAPWGFVGLILLAVSLAQGRRWRHQSFETQFWWFALLLSPCFFTFSGNILWTYVLPSLAPLAILLAPHVAKGYEIKKWRYGIIGLFVLAPTLMVGYVAIWHDSPQLRTEKFLIQRFMQKHPEKTLSYVDGVPFSAQFYSQGQAHAISLAEVRHIPAGDYIAMSPSALAELQKNGIQTIMEGSSRRYVLLKILR